MAAIWATPANVRAYSAYPEVDAKTDPELEILLEKAEGFIKVFCCSDYADADANQLDQLKIIDCAMVEMFVLGEGNQAWLTGVFKSEIIGDYTYIRNNVNVDAPTGDPYIDTILTSFRRCGGGRPGPVFFAYGPTRLKEGLVPGQPVPTEVEEIITDAGTLIVIDEEDNE
jgi:hypothetical protein